jgi:alginate O-acetyltransferase complex protein AlgI
MLFTEYRFFAFFALVFCVHWALRSNHTRKLWLLLCSYCFYAAWDWRFLSLILISTTVDYVAGLRVAREQDDNRRAWLVISLATNLGLLATFKYFNFFIESAADLFVLLGIPFGAESLNIVLPVGISFYTFQTLSYTIDIYRRRLSPTRDPLDLALFVAFFPQLVAGPIVRAAHFLPQLRASRQFATVAVKPLLCLFFLGFVKKACVADNLAPIVDAYFSQPEAFNAASAWLATVAYAIQIYCDFSGYSDMAIACAGLLGYQLPRNFSHPYFAGDIASFWRRWHISLSTWLRDYLYVPLGGNRGNRLFVYRNLMITMLLGGLWHGAAWNFVIWGGLHGVALVVHREWRSRISTGGRDTNMAHRFGGGLLTFYWVCLCWIFFRAPDLQSALIAARSFTLFQSLGDASVASPGWWILISGLALVHGVSRRFEGTIALDRVPAWLFAGAYGACFALALAFVPRGYTPFIYFQF